MHKFAAIVYDIRHMLNKDWTIRLEHTLREGKFCADFITKIGASNIDRMKVFHSPPQGISTFLLADTSGVAFLRM